MGEWMYDIHVFLTWALDGDVWSASRPGCFRPKERPPELVWVTWRGEKSYPYRDSNSDPSAVQLLGSGYTDCAISAHYTILVQLENEPTKRTVIIELQVLL
jgi:hypothetical protein